MGKEKIAEELIALNKRVNFDGAILSEEATRFLKQWLNSGETMELPGEEVSQHIWTALVDSCPYTPPGGSGWITLLRGCGVLCDGRVESYSPDPECVVGFAGENGFVIARYVNCKKEKVFNLTNFLQKIKGLEKLDDELKALITMYENEEEYFMRTDGDASAFFRYQRHGGVPSAGH